MALDNYGTRYYYSHRYWSWRWDLAPPRARVFIASPIRSTQVGNPYRPDFFLTHFYSPSNPVITLAEQYILNDTSLAALILANGDRHLFFQDNTGLIRRAVRTASNNQWSTSPTLSVDSNAKNHTPLAANQVLSDIIDSPWPSVMPNV